MILLFSTVFRKNFFLALFLFLPTLYLVVYRIYTCFMVCYTTEFLIVRCFFVLYFLVYHVFIYLFKSPAEPILNDIFPTCIYDSDTFRLLSSPSSSIGIY